MGILEALQNSKNEDAYRLLLELEAESAESNSLYQYFNDFVGMTNNLNSYVRVRGFRLCCAQARWDTESKMEQSIEKLLMMLEDDKPTAVRQCLAALHAALLYKPDLSSVIEKKLAKLDLSKYKDSMRPLIEKDIDELRKIFI